jgi:hypothetical protein
MTDNYAETDYFGYADRRIAQLLDKLKTKGVCGCCTARALLFHGIGLMEETMGSDETIELCEDFIRALRERDRPAPDRSPSSRH